jgi:uncharacterized Ntn-hydrolase superfamily protein
LTVSVAARCRRTGAFGIAIASSSPAVAARCAHVRAGVGVVATQNVTDPRLGPRGLDLLAEMPAEQALARLVAEAPHVAYRQLALVDRRGRSAVYSGARALGLHGATAHPDVAVAGNLLAGDAVLPAILARFDSAPADPLGDRLVAALQAGLAAGGEAGPIRSAGLLIAQDVEWPVADLRVDWDETDPLAALARLWALWRPQMQAYVTRALDPDAAPGF